MAKIKTRFAPSPTGYLHIGGARTALYSWLYARRHGGHFVLRIEDTDRERSTQESVNVILEGMSWLGLDYDEGPFYQTERFDRYRELTQRLLDEGLAYRCYCSKERLDALRQEQMANKQKPRYDGRCRDLTEPPEGAGEPVIRFRNPLDGEVVVEDRVRGRVVFRNSELDDLIIARADGTPTYNFTVVVDDMDMGITHVVRGDDHLNNTPRQVNLYRALGVEPPVFAHVPMILGEDGKRLSKRHGAVSVLQYRDQGYLPEAVLNYLVRLGWSHGDQEVFTLDEMVSLFDLEDINHSASTFNPQKLLWLNQQHIMRAEPAHVARYLAHHLGERDIDPADGPPLEAVVAAQQERAKTLVEMAENSLFFYRDPADYEPKAARKNLKPETEAALVRVRDLLSELEDWRPEAIHECVLKAAEVLELKLGKVAQPVRVAVSGGPVSPPIDQTLALLGKEATLRRIQAAIDWIDRQAAG
ncbi:glutamate--tRNA ligase [Alkalilimnicola ehrlichii MLHE-1]|uniref:Glutamate--tRNA ligase 1 n=1 Tax=Alkalilimnicola ehrlichii (strain ATCC BAA-1101 / DSM 17681 / MLHE-1) TaxID=187272 RepID=SYE1_ALKEH|nr:glutamate--tRNA ligase [Alkalilimnicola ehrlichii]Q0A936.1 RecName: Full=Glutamate--tRNA ligase 1; AltName: Full=Glutamyl-tRNA synthetase 1; Short=GluRS 1 [Alkalilimnicola ehrlichii MLHE-1]ABI56651.1 glutamyl-tRNA synthetase [Alkalilimnicola ehrlichii MLHE-1]